MVDPVAISDERVGHAAQIEQLVPIPIVACETRHLETEDDPHATQGDYRGQLIEALSLCRGAAGDAEILIDDLDLGMRPAELVCAACQLVLTVGGFSVLMHLRRGRLSHVHNGTTTQVASSDLSSVTHLLAPFLLLRSLRCCCTPGCAPSIPPAAVSLFLFARTGAAPESRLLRS